MQGSEDCLSGLDFVVTGVLDSIERSDAEDLIKQHGGAVKSGVSKKTSYVVAGRDPGETKTKKVYVLFQRLPGVLFVSHSYSFFIGSAVSLPGQTLVISFAPEGCLHIFCLSWAQPQASDFGAPIPYTFQKPSIPCMEKVCASGKFYYDLLPIYLRSKTIICRLQTKFCRICSVRCVFSTLFDTEDLSTMHQSWLMFLL